MLKSNLFGTPHSHLSGVLHPGYGATDSYQLLQDVRTAQGPTNSFLPEWSSKDRESTENNEAGEIWQWYQENMSLGL